MDDIADALARLGQYNGLTYDPNANRYGFAGRGGMPANLPQFCRDVGTVGSYVQVTYQLIQGAAGSGLSLPAGLNNTPLGATTPAAATVTTLTTTGQASLGGSPGTEALRAVPVAGATRRVEVSGSVAGNATLGTNAGGLALSPADGTAKLTGGVTATVFEINSPGRADLLLNHSGAGADLKRLMVRGSSGALKIGWENDAVSAYAEQVRINCATGATRALTLTGSAAGDPIIGTTAGRIAFSAIPVLPGYTVGTLPSATAAGLIYVSNGTGSKRLAVSDGTNWRWPDGTIVS